MRLNGKQIGKSPLVLKLFSSEAIISTVSQIVLFPRYQRLSKASDLKLISQQIHSKGKKIIHKKKKKISDCFSWLRLY